MLRATYRCLLRKSSGHAVRHGLGWPPSAGCTTKETVTFVLGAPYRAFVFICFSPRRSLWPLWRICGEKHRCTFHLYHQNYEGVLLASRPHGRLHRDSLSLKIVHFTRPLWSLWCVPILPDSGTLRNLSQRSFEQGNCRPAKTKILFLQTLESQEQSDQSGARTRMKAENSINPVKATVPVARCPGQSFFHCAQNRIGGS